jgi:hypothetical protein
MCVLSCRSRHHLNLFSATCLPRVHGSFVCASKSLVQRACRLSQHSVDALVGNPVFTGPLLSYNSVYVGMFA